MVALQRIPHVAISVAALVGCGGSSSATSRQGLVALDAGRVVTEAGEKPFQATACSESPIQLANLRAPAWPTALSVSATDLYFATLGNATASILRVPLSGGTPSVITSFNGVYSFDMVVTPTRLIYSISSTTTTGLFSAALNGASPAKLASMHGALVGVDSENVYFSAPDGIKTVPLVGGGAPRTISTQTGSAALAGSQILIADGAGGGVFTIGTSNTVLTTLASAQVDPSAPVGCGKGICWVNNQSGGVTIQQGLGTLLRKVPDAPPVSLAMDAVLFGAERALFDGSSFFVLTGIDAPTIAKVGGDGRPIVTIGARVFAMALDNACLYWADAFGIFSVAKSLPNSATLDASSE